ncbi:MAG: hypothetical protein ACTSU2_12190 [Promethearchaeota archaeon]
MKGEKFFGIVLPITTWIIAILQTSTLSNFEKFMNVFSSIVPYISMIMNLYIPLLTPIGEALRSTAENILNALPFGDLTPYIIVSVVVMVLGIISALKFGEVEQIEKEDEELLKKEYKKYKQELKSQKRKK